MVLTRTCSSALCEVSYLIVTCFFYPHSTFLLVMVKILLPIWVISWAVLMPVTSVHTGVPGNSGLVMFTYGNVAPQDSARYSAHLVLAWLFTCKYSYIFFSSKFDIVSNLS